MPFNTELSGKRVKKKELILSQPRLLPNSSASYDRLVCPLQRFVQVFPFYEGEKYLCLSPNRHDVLKR
jgi:hypothetical protein